MVTEWLNRVLHNESQLLPFGRKGVAEDWLALSGLSSRPTSTLSVSTVRRKYGPYVLATGEAAVQRLKILHELYGPGTWRALHDAGVRSGMRVADFGCGVGLVTSMLAEIVGPEGHAVGFDVSAGQIAEARERVNGDCGHISFVQANATSTGWPDESFDLVYCRFLLIHLRDPEVALAEMTRVLKPGGIIVCEDGDLTSAGSEPASALDAFAMLFGQLVRIAA